MHFLLQKLSVFPNTFLLAWGWRRRLLTVLCGAISALALPPYNALPILFLSFSCFVWILDGALHPGHGNRVKNVRTGFALGWLFGFGYFLAGLWWIGAAFLVEADRYAWLLPFAVLAMPVGLALFTGVGAALAALLWTDRRLRIVLLAACFALADLVRGTVLTGFPWNSFGYTFSGSLTLSQIASVVGVYGLSFLSVSIFAAPAVFADVRPLRQKLTASALAVVALVGIGAFGAVRLSTADTRLTDLDIRIIQPSISQLDKWRPELREDIFQTYLDMTEAPLGGTARVDASRLVVWPESAVPFLLTQEPGALSRIARSLGERSELATGAVRAEPGEEGSRYFNSIYLIASDGTVSSLYDKVQLVPFGEYVPFRAVFRKIGLTNLAGPMEGFEAGYTRHAVTTSEGFSFLPLICYEAIFPVQYSGQQLSPAFLLNVTNDAWFGRTPGPYQHFAQARMRSIETGLPMVRAANTGVSALIDGYGKVTAKIDIFEKGVIDGNLPQGIAGTIYDRFGNIITIIVALIIVVFATFSQYNRHSR